MTPHLDIWPPASARSNVPQAGRLPFPLAAPSCALFARARHGLWVGTRRLGLGAGDVVLAPAYHHGSEIEALARAGVACRFYGRGTDLAPDPAELEELVDPRVRALLLVHYLGFPQDAARWRAWCDERELLLLEDAAQGWLGSGGGAPLGSSGHLAIFCLYKAVGVPDGAAVVVDAATPPVPPPNRPRGVAFAVRALAGRAAHRLAAVLSSPAPYVAQRDFALGDPTRPPSPASLALLPRLAGPDVPERRRANYTRLLGELGDLVPTPFGHLPDGASPMVFPVHAPGDDKSALLERLERAGIDALDFWSVPHPSLPVDQFPEVAARRRVTVGLPVHQALGPDDLDRIARAVPA